MKNSKFFFLFAIALIIIVIYTISIRPWSGKNDELSFLNANAPPFHKVVYMNEKYSCGGCTSFLVDLFTNVPIDSTLIFIDRDSYKKYFERNKYMARLTFKFIDNETILDKYTGPVMMISDSNGLHWKLYHSSDQYDSLAVSILVENKF